jgi:hypothetical protein
MLFSVFPIENKHYKMEYNYGRSFAHFAVAYIDLKNRELACYWQAYFMDN